MPENKQPDITSLNERLVEEICAKQGSSRDPDYVGAWQCAHFEELAREELAYSKGRLPRPIHNKFHLWINRYGNSEEFNFTGKSLDTYGFAAVSGILTPTKIRFAKRYNQEARQKGGRSGELIYEGIRHQVRTGELIEDYISGLITEELKDPMAPLPFVMLNTPPVFVRLNKGKLLISP
jgi:hypothetical protein